MSVAAFSQITQEDYDKLPNETRTQIEKITTEKAVEDSAIRIQPRTNSNNYRSVNQEIKLAEAEKNKQSGIANQKAANIAKANTAAESEKAKAEKISAIAKADSNRAESLADSKKAEAEAKAAERSRSYEVAARS